jgi:hypothetical protein
MNDILKVHLGLSKMTSKLPSQLTCEITYITPVISFLFAHKSGLLDAICTKSPDFWWRAIFGKLYADFFNKWIFIMAREKAGICLKKAGICCKIIESRKKDNNP